MESDRNYSNRFEWFEFFVCEGKATTNVCKYQEGKRGMSRSVVTQFNQNVNAIFGASKQRDKIRYQKQSILIKLQAKLCVIIRSQVTKYAHL